MFIFSYDEGSRDGKSQAAFCLFGPSSPACDFHPHAYHIQKKKKKILLFFSFIGRERHQSQLDNLLSCDKSTDPMTSTSIRKTFHCPAGLLCSSQSVPTLSINTASLLIHIQSFHLF